MLFLDAVIARNPSRERRGFVTCMLYGTGDFVCQGLEGEFQIVRDLKKPRRNSIGGGRSVLIFVIRTPWDKVRTVT